MQKDELNVHYFKTETNAAQNQIDAFFSRLDFP